MSDEGNYEHTEVLRGTDPSDYDKLTIPGGVSIDDEGVVKMELIYDGEVVITRGDDGELMSMGTLCYLDYLVNKFVGELIEEDGETTNNPAGITPGHILCHVIQALHEQMHMVEVQKKLEVLGRMMGEGAEGNPLAALAALGLSPVGAFMVGPDGEIAQVANPEDLMSRLAGEGGGGLVLDGETDSEDDDGIYVQGLRIEAIEIKNDDDDNTTG